MNHDLYVREKLWTLNQAELARKNERRRLVAEARAASKDSLATTGSDGQDFKPNLKLGKEKLGWN